MAIQMRRGAFTDFDPTQMLPGEWAVMLSDDEETIDGYAVYICYAAGMVKRIVSSDELAALSNNIYADVEDFVNEAFDVDKIMLAATTARTAAAEAQAAIDAIGDIASVSVPLMSSSTRGGAKLGVGLEITDGALSVDPDSIEFSTMSPSTRGIAKLGAGLAVSDDALTVDPMSDTQIDGVMAFDPEEDDPITDVEPLTPTGLLYFWGQLKTWAAATFAALSHNHAASDITSGTLGVSRGGTGQTTKAGIRNTLGLGNTTDALPVANGGTGSTSASDARTALGITLSNIGAAAASHTHAAGSDLTGQVPVANGGTGAATASGARTNLGAAAASHTHDASTDLTGQVPIANGGTGASTAAAALTALGAASQDDMDDAEQAIADNAAAIATLGESVSHLHFGNGVTSFTVTQDSWDSRYLSFRIVGSMGDYTIILRSADVIVYDNLQNKTLKRLYWDAAQ